MKTDLFQSCDHCWVFPICWHIVCSTLTASSFRIWNSSAGIPPPSGMVVWFGTILVIFLVLIPSLLFGVRFLLTSGNERLFVFFSESHGGRSLVGYSPRDCKESDMTELVHFHFSPFLRTKKIIHFVIDPSSNAVHQEHLWWNNTSITFTYSFISK